MNTSIEYATLPRNGVMASCSACKQKLEVGEIRIISRYSSGKNGSKSWHPSCGTGHMKGRILAQDAKIKVVGVTDAEMQTIRLGLRGGKKEEEEEEEKVSTPSAKKPVKRTARGFESDDNRGSGEDDAAPPPRKKPARQAALAKKAVNPFESSDSDEDEDEEEEEDTIDEVASPAPATILPPPSASKLARKAAPSAKVAALQPSPVRAAGAVVDENTARVFASHEAFAKGGGMTSANMDDLIAIQKAALGLK